MSERAEELPASSDTAVANVARFGGTIALLVALIAVLLAFDLFLAGIARRDATAHAEAEYRAGTALLAAGRARQAAERFGTAVAADRKTTRYALALAEARLADGRAADAEATLGALLERAGNDGAVNLAMARTLRREGRVDEAVAYFHRAIFGQWGADSTPRRIATRFELIDLLDRRGATQQLLAELLPLEDTPPDSVALRRRLGLLFVRAGSPARGVAMLREVLRREPRDADAYAGMGEAALALGNFRTARADFAEALQLRPDDARLADRLAVADTVLAIDPAARDLGAHARYVRSRALLVHTLAARIRCRGGGPAAALDPRFDGARSALLANTRAADEDAAGEKMVALASDLWSARPPSCARVAAEEPVALVLGLIAREP